MDVMEILETQYTDKMEGQIIFLLCLQINKTIKFILNMEYFGYIIGSKKEVIL